MTNWNLIVHAITVSYQVHTRRFPSMNNEIHKYMIYINALII